MDRKRKWLLMGGAGASLFGFGLCATIESGFLKHGGAPWWHWAGFGTVSLAIAMLGLVLLIKAGILEKEFD